MKAMYVLWLLVVFIVGFAVGHETVTYTIRVEASPEMVPFMPEIQRQADEKVRRALAAARDPNRRK